MTKQFGRETNQDGDSFFSHPSSLNMVFEPCKRLIKIKQSGGSSASGQSEQRGKAWSGFEEIHLRRSKARPRSVPRGDGHHRFGGEALMKACAKVRRTMQ